MKRFAWTKIVSVVALLVCSVALLQGCGDGSTKLQKALINVALNHHDPDERSEALEALEELPLTESSFNAFVSVMRNDDDEGNRDYAAHLLSFIADESPKWRLRCTKAIEKASQDGKINPQYKGTLWATENPEKAERVKAEIDKRVNAPVVALRQRLEVAEKKRASVADEYSEESPRPARKLRESRDVLVGKVADELLAEDQERPYSERKANYNLYTSGFAVEKDPRVVALDKQIAAMAKEAAIAEKQCQDLQRLVADAEAKSKAASEDLYSKGLEVLYREWFEK